MKVAVLADIHGNLPALEAVLADLDQHRPDTVVVAGDIINRGAQPRECLERILERQHKKQWRVLRGNHEDFVLREARIDATRPAWLTEVCAHTTWTYNAIRKHADAIAALPDQIDLALEDRHDIRIVHASMRGNRLGLFPHMSDEDVLQHVAPAPPVLCAGHTHIPFFRQINGTLIVNAGAVGLPFDGDPRASYALLEWQGTTWQATIVRVDYDRSETEAAMRRSGYLEEAGPMVPLIVDELRRARPNLARWHRDYEEAVAEGQLGITESVQLLLQARHKARAAQKT